MSIAMNELDTFGPFMAMAGEEGHTQSLHHGKDLLWKEFLRDSSQCVDNRSTKQPLWLDSRRSNPSRLKQEHLRHDDARKKCNTTCTQSAFLPSLWACCKSKDLSQGTKIHDQIQKSGLAEKEFTDALVTMYSKCGELHQAQSLLDMHSSTNIIPWSALIASYTRDRQGQKALDCFNQMQHEGVSPNAVAYVSVLQACAMIGAIDKGKQIHDEISSRGLLERNVVLGGALVGMYAKCGALSEAQNVLERLPSRNIFCWSALIAGYTQNGQGEQALECFKRMQQEGILSDAVTYGRILTVCGRIGAIDKGKQIHDEISKQGLLKHNILLGGALVGMYAKCGALSQAQSVLENLPSGNVVMWNALLAGYVQKEQGQQALKCFEQMQQESIQPDAVTYLSALKACALMRAIDMGKLIHDEIARQGLMEQSIALGNALVDMYAKCGALPQAKSVLEKLPCRDAISWSALIAGYAQKGEGQQALQCFEHMQHEGIAPDAVTYACILKACAVLGALEKGKQIHDEISRQGWLEHDIVLSTALVDMYAKCGALGQARNVVEKLASRNAISWNALITGLAEKGRGEEALECFEQMQHEGICPDVVTYVCVVKACAAIRAIDKGKKIHEKILGQGLLEHSIVLGNALVDMYAKCGALPQAKSVLEKLPSRDASSWNALIIGYAQKGQGQYALECLERMEGERITPDAVTYICVLKACASIGAIDKGKEIHDEISRQGLLEHDIVLGSALVDMYAKCGALPRGQCVLERLPSRNVVSWNALIAGYAQECQFEQALKCFEQMQGEGILPDMVTFLCLLNMCSHLGLVEKGEELFDDMRAKYGLKPDLECCTCMVNLLGRAGHLVKAVELIEEMPHFANSAIWHCLLGACSKWADVKVGIWAFEQAVRLDRWDGGAYMQMMTIYAAAGMPEKAREMESLRKNTKPLLAVGHSWSIAPR